MLGGITIFERGGTSYGQHQMYFIYENCDWMSYAQEWMHVFKWGGHRLA